MKSQTLKAMAFIELILGIILSISAGAIFKTVDTESVLISEAERAIASFNYSLALSIFLSVIILFIILYALYSIQQNVETIKDELLQLHDDTDISENSYAEDFDESFAKFDEIR